MIRFCIAALSVAVASVLLLAPRVAVSQQPSLKQQLAGTWTLVSIIATDKAGNKSDRRGPNPKGLFILEPNGYFSILTARADIPNFAVSNINQGTTEEYKTTMMGFFASIGKWSVDESTKVITTYVEAGSFPNLNGHTQSRTISLLTADELRYVNGTSVSATSDEATWRRVK